MMMMMMMIMIILLPFDIHLSLCSFRQYNSGVQLLQTDDTRSDRPMFSLLDFLCFGGISAASSSAAMARLARGLSRPCDPVDSSASSESLVGPPWPGRICYQLINQSINQSINQLKYINIPSYGSIGDGDGPYILPYPAAQNDPVHIDTLFFLANLLLNVPEKGF